MVADVPTTDLEIDFIDVEGGDPTDYGYARDLMIAGDRFFLLENREHRLTVFNIGKTLIYGKILASKGEGPGEIWIPSFIAPIPDAGFVIYENRGLSFFDRGGSFEKQFRIFTPGFGLAASRNRIFLGTTRVDDPHLIDIFDFEGEKLASVLPGWFKVESARGDVVTRARHRDYMFQGQLLADESHLYYLNATFGRFFKLDHEGEVVEEKDTSDSFGAKGRITIDSNREYLEKPALMEQPSGWTVNILFEHAAIARGKLYCLRTLGVRPDLDNRVKDIFVFDCADFSLLEILHFRMEQGEWMNTIAVWDDGKRRRIFGSMESNRHIDYRLIELVP